ncbi:MAG: NAD/NADP octopine/nopaline dehydrogenase family protein [Desulfuromusa sp.]|nr:NAD/NADP octopine/nopaline dehydrogenase family protein [Desulfuromusa sp.]
MMNKKIAILGGGHGAHGMAVDLISRGFTVNLFEMPEFRQNIEQLFTSKTIESSGTVEGRFELNLVTTDIDQAIAGVKYILIVTPAFAHEGYAKLLKGRVNEDQVVVLYPGAFAALLFKSIFAEEPCPVIAEANNLPYDTRITAPCKISIFGLNPINIAFMPAEKGPELIEEMRSIHSFGRVYDDVLEAGLSLVNPGVHTGPCLTSISAIENWPKRSFFLYEHGVTPGAMKINRAIDHERKAVGEKFGYHLTPTEDFSGLKEGYSWQDLYMTIHGNISLTPISGPHEINSRYFTEDCPFGLVPWSVLGKLVGVDTPTIDSAVNIYNQVHECNWWEKGRNIEDLGIEKMTVEQIKTYVKTGR